MEPVDFAKLMVFLVLHECGSVEWDLISNSTLFVHRLVKVTTLFVHRLVKVTLRNTGEFLITDQFDRLTNCCYYSSKSALSQRKRNVDTRFPLFSD